jgi:predicted RNA-binding protein with PUA-like domain
MIRQEKSLAKMLLLARGSRLSIQPVKRSEFEIICKLGKIVRSPMRRETASPST